MFIILINIQISDISLTKNMLVARLLTFLDFCKKKKKMPAYCSDEPKHHIVVWH